MIFRLVMTPTYRFKLGAEEVLVESYACALSSKDIHLRGLLYIFPRHLCFGCDQLGHAKSICIPFAEAKLPFSLALALSLCTRHSSLCRIPPMQSARCAASALWRGPRLTERCL